jgi:hypothetical protein
MYYKINIRVHLINNSAYSVFGRIRGIYVHISRRGKEEGRAGSGLRHDRVVPLFVRGFGGCPLWAWWPGVIWRGREGLG